MTVITNRAQNPSAETDTTGYTAVPGTTGAVAAGCVSTTSTTAFGTKVTRATWTTASTAAGGGIYYEVTLAAAGLAVGDTISAAVFHVLSSIINRLQFSVEFRTDVATISTSSAATQLVTAAGTICGSAAAPDAAMKLEGLVIPATTTRIRVRVLSIAGTSYANWSIGSYLQLDGVQVEKSATLHPYVDGSLGNAYGWAGTAGASSSSFYTPAVAVLDISDLPKVGVRVTLTDMFPTADTATLFRLVEGKNPQEVRDAIGIAAAGGFTAPDYEIPLGVPFTYRAMVYDVGGGELGYTPDSSPTTITPVLGDGAQDWGIISDPLRPDSAVVVQFTENAARRPSRPVRRNLLTIGTASGVRVVALTSPRGLIERLPMDFWTETSEDADAFDEMVTESQGLLLIRSFEPLPVPRLLYVHAPDPIPDDVDTLTTELVEWLVTVDEVSPSTSGYGQPLFPWSDYEAQFPLWSDMEAAYLTWLAAAQNPPAGA